MDYQELNELTYKINGAVFEVNRVLGGGFLEKVYEKALLIELNIRGVNAAGSGSIKGFLQRKYCG